MHKRRMFTFGLKCIRGRKSASILRADVDEINRAAIYESQQTDIKHYVICTLKTEYRKYLVSIIIDNAKINIEVYLNVNTTNQSM